MSTIYWVVETVAADHVGTINDFSDPFGIQAAIDAASLLRDQDVRLVRGSNNYDSTTASWTNRDFGGTTIYTKQTNGHPSACRISGWVDETTRGLVTLDFTGGAGNGFARSSGESVFFDIVVTGAVITGFQNAYFIYNCHAYNNGGQGIQCNGVILRCSSYNNGDNGFYESDFTTETLFCKSFNNSSIGFRSTNRGTVSSSMSVQDNDGFMNHDYPALFCELLSVGAANYAFLPDVRNSFFLIFCTAVDGEEALGDTTDNRFILNTYWTIISDMNDAGVDDVLQRDIGSVVYNCVDGISAEFESENRKTDNPNFIDPTNNDYRVSNSDYRNIEFQPPGSINPFYSTFDLGGCQGVQ